MNRNLFLYGLFVSCGVCLGILIPHSLHWLIGGLLSFAFFGLGLAYTAALEEQQENLLPPKADSGERVSLSSELSETPPSPRGGGPADSEIDVKPFQGFLHFVSSKEDFPLPGKTDLKKGDLVIMVDAEGVRVPAPPLAWFTGERWERLGRGPLLYGRPVDPDNPKSGTLVGRARNFSKAIVSPSKKLKTSVQPSMQELLRSPPLSLERNTVSEDQASHERQPVPQPSESVFDSENSRAS